MVPAIYSERHEAALPLGKHDATPLRSGTVSFAELRKPLAAKGLLPTTPRMFGHGHDFSQGLWLMLGNGPDDSVYPGFEGCGDCAWVDPAHDEMEAARNAGHAIPRFTGKVIVEQYSEYSGYDARSGANDTGSNMQDVLAWRQQKGLRDADGRVYKIGRAVSVEPGNLQHLWEAAWLFENVNIGLELQQAQENQFNERAQPTWDYVPGSQTVGGHAVPVMGRLGLISWAEDVYFTPRFIEHQMDEGYCYIDPLRYSRVTGKDYEGFTDADLEKFIVLVAQGKA